MHGRRSRYRSIEKFYDAILGLGIDPGIRTPCEVLTEETAAYFD